MIAFYKPPISRDLPPILYQYTTRAGLLGITAKPASIWASNIRYLNDSTEFDAAVTIASSVSEELLSSGINDNEKNLLESFRIWISSWNATQYQSYICSFTENGNLLSQWRGYTKPGDGYSIGFDSQTLFDICRTQDYFLIPCEYDLLVQRSLIEQIITNGFDLLKAGEQPDDVVIKLLFSFLYTAPMIKNDNFKEESEWRLVTIFQPNPPDTLLFRSGKFTLIPYRLFKLGDVLPIKKVIIGPNPHGPLDSQAIINLLQIRGAPAGISCEWSNIPFRDF